MYGCYNNKNTGNETPAPSHPNDMIMSILDYYGKANNNGRNNKIIFRMFYFACIGVLNFSLYLSQFTIN